MKPKGLRHLALKTRKPKAAEAFYTEVLGLEVAFREKRMVFLRSPGGDDLLNLIQTRGRVDPDRGGLDHFGIHFSRREFAKVKAAVTQAGVPVVGRRGRWSLYVEDPDGYTVELYAD